jgi:hypothetical protein
MTAGPPADGPALSRWWDRLSPLRPRDFWVGSLDLVHLEAPVQILQRRPIDPLHRLLLRAIEEPADLQQLDDRLALGRSALHRWFEELCGAGLVRTGERYALTQAGLEALDAGINQQTIIERRRFTYVIERDGSAHYLPWLAPVGEAAPAIAAVADIGWLTACVARPTAWKQRMRFPEDVAGIEEQTSIPGAAAWKRLAVAYGEQPVVALVVTSESPSQLFGFTTRGEGPDLHAPAMRLDSSWEDAFPELAGELREARMVVGDWSLVGEGRLRRVERVVGPARGAGASQIGQ